MFKNISFSGKVFYSAKIENDVTKKEFEYLKKYSDKQDCDVFVQERTQYKDGEGVFTGYAEKNHTLYDITIDTKNPLKNSKSRTQMPPEYYY